MNVNTNKIYIQENKQTPAIEAREEAAVWWLMHDRQVQKQHALICYIDGTLLFHLI